LDHPGLGGDDRIFGRLVGSALEAPPSADDKRIFFVIGAGLLAIVLFLIAEAWQFLTIKHRGD
jgi:hypothetical protein